MQKLFSQFNVQSNVVVAATYSDERNGPLEVTLLFRALREVIEKQPSLGIVMHEEPSKAKKGNHRSWEGRLKNINLSDCVSFLDDYDASSNGFQGLLEKAHNEWFDVNDKTKPLWRVLVVNRIHVLFTFNHFIGDGSSGVNFHHSLLSALNHVSRDDKDGPTSPGPVVQISNNPLPPSGMDSLQEQFSYYMLLVSVVQMLYLYIIRSTTHQKYWTFPDTAKFGRFLPSTSKSPIDLERPVTKVQRIHLNPVTLSACLQVCKGNNVSFTALLYTLISITLAVDIYPEAKITNSSTQVNLRRFVHEKQRHVVEKNMSNMAASFYYRPWLKEYRAAEVPVPRSPSPITNGSFKNNQKAATINPTLFWDLARKYKGELDANVAVPRSTTSALVQDVLTMYKLMPSDDEPFGEAIFGAMSAVVPHCFALSNLGAFAPASNPGSEEAGGAWTISNMEFSVAATKISVGPALYFAVISVKGGACVVNVNYQEGVLEDEMITRMISGIERRLLAVLD